MTQLYFFMEVVSVQGAGWINPGDTSKLDEASSPLLLHPTCPASLLVRRAPGRGGNHSTERVLGRDASPQR